VLVTGAPRFVGGFKTRTLLRGARDGWWDCRHGDPGRQETRVIESRSRRPVAAPALTFALFLALLLVVSAPIALYDVFSTFMAHDDEGFFLRIVKHFPDGFSLSLYDEIRVSFFGAWAGRCAAYQRRDPVCFDSVVAGDCFIELVLDLPCQPERARVAAGLRDGVRTLACVALRAGTPA
jgi:hypothetical protein